MERSLKILEEQDSRLKEFTIVFSGLKEGEHSFNFQIDDSFFECFEESPLQKGALTVALSFIKNNGFFILNFHIDGTIHVACDRCTAAIDVPLTTEYEVYVRFATEFSQASTNDNVEVLFLQPGAFQLNVAHLIFESTILNVPSFKTCTAEEEEIGELCNHKILDVLEGDLEVEEKTETDPRWEALKKLKKK